MPSPSASSTRPQELTKVSIVLDFKNDTSTPYIYIHNNAHIQMQPLVVHYTAKPASVALSAK